MHPRLRAALDDGLRFDRLWDLALYEPGVGFYDTGGAAGRRADFLTSVELGPLFGACLARHLDALWDAAGRPSRWTLVDVGSGPGTLVRTVLAAQPRCVGALDVVVVERSAAQRKGHGELIAWARARGVLVVSQAELPQGVCGVIVAHELLDNLAARVVQRNEGRVEELWAEAAPITGANPPGASGAPVPSDGPDGPNGQAVVLSWRPVEIADAERLEALDWWAAVPDRAPVPWNEAAQQWVGEALGRLTTGSLVVIDYGTRTTAELAGREGWLRTYAQGAVGTDPVEDLGRRDLTSDVPFDQLPSPDRMRTQAETLVAWGIEDLVRSAGRRLEERPGTMDLAWARDTSALNEAPALIDPAGLGAFLVAEWDAHA